MHNRAPRKIKRYITDPEQLPSDKKSKYNNLTLNELKLQVNAVDTLTDISIPQIAQKPPNNQKNTNLFIPFHSKFHARRNPLKRLPDLNTLSHNNNGWELSKAIKGPNMFKRNNPLFVVNSLFEILKQDVSIDQNTQEKPVPQPKERISRIPNEFSDFDGKSVKLQRGPRLMQNQLTRRTQQANLSRRKIYSQEKSRQKVQQVQLLTFYKPKQKRTQEVNQFLS